MAARRFVLSHLSDVHVSAFDGARVSDFFNKRLTGLINLKLLRRNAFSSRVLRAALRDMDERGVDHCALTGDVTNLSLEAEFRAAHRIFAAHDPDGTKMSVVPGNHDYYLRRSVGDRFFQDMFAAYMSSTPALASASASTSSSSSSSSGDGSGFPFLRALGSNGHIGLLGLNSAVPRPPFVASGEVHPKQLEAADALLGQHGGSFATRILMLHHPPVTRFKHEDRMGLHGKDAIAQLCATHGISLVLHGHSHQPFVGGLPGAPATTVVEAGSGTYVTRSARTPPGARYNVYTFDATGQMEAMAVRVWDPEAACFRTEEPPKPNTANLRSF